ncbi:MAG TPA: aminoacyl-tRNA hydrolase [Burkholderiaceae bacterium]|nr:aminoacyl-tRNA hydrolase [Burkholderiaceae bacterium]
MADDTEPRNGIRLIVGLGNFGAEYAATRHNAGYWLVDAIARRAGVRFSGERKFHGDAARIRLAGRDVWLLKPTTYMNRSGQSVVAVALFYKILPTEILVAHDELDLPPGAVKLKRGGGTAGHNGLKDTQALLSTADFWRLRIGIGHPRSLQLEQDVADFVLHPPRRDELAAIDEAVGRGEGIVELLAEGRFEAAMLRLHTK